VTTGFFNFEKKKQALKLKLAYSYLLKQLHPLINAIKAERYCTLCLAWDPSVHTPKYSQTVLLSYAYCSHTALLVHVTEQTGLLEKKLKRQPLIGPRYKCNSLVVKTTNQLKITANMQIWVRTKFFRCCFAEHGK